jgi:cytochrome c553
MTKNLFVAITTSTALAVTVPALASNAGNPAAGQKKSTVCVACHGKDGKSTNPMWPNLSNQSAPYLLKQLQDFKAGRRSDPSMDPIMKQLSPQDMADLAAYYASQGNRTQGPSNNMSWNQNSMSGPNPSMNWKQNPNQRSGPNSPRNWNQNSNQGWNNMGNYGQPNRNQMSGPNPGMNWNQNQNPMSGQNSAMNWNQNQNPMSGQNSGMNSNPNQNMMSGWGNMGNYGNPNHNPMSAPHSGNGNQNMPMSGPNSSMNWNPNMNSMSGPNSGMNWNPNMTPNSGMNWNPNMNPNMNPMSGPNSGMNWHPNMNPMSGPNSGMNWNPNMNSMSGPNSGFSGNENINSMPSAYMSDNSLVMREGETFGVVMGDNPADTESGMWALIAMPSCLRLVDRFSKPLPSAGAGSAQEQVFVFQAQDSCRATIGFTRRSNQGVTAHKSYHVLVQ